MPNMTIIIQSIDDLSCQGIGIPEQLEFASFSPAQAQACSMLAQ
jgi:hypothetical protein